MQFGNPELNGGGGWGIFNAVLGWQNSATYGSVISYNLYWVFVMTMFLSMRYHEVKGHWPLMKAKEDSVVETELVETEQPASNDSTQAEFVENKAYGQAAPTQVVSTSV